MLLNILHIYFFKYIFDSSFISNYFFIFLIVQLILSKNMEVMDGIYQMLICVLIFMYYMNQQRAIFVSSILIYYNIFNILYFNILLHLKVIIKY